MNIDTNNIKYEKTFDKIKTDNVMVRQVNMMDPKAPAYVLLGLILVNLGPLNNLPTTKPPISDAIQPNTNVKRIAFI